MKTSEASQGASTLKTSELLRKAADEIRRRGWHQGDYGWSRMDPENCGVCSIGAIRAASSGTPWDPYFGGGVFAPLKREIGTWDIVGWNDKPGRTVEEVLDAFEKAAVAAELEES